MGNNKTKIVVFSKQLNYLKQSLLLLLLLLLCHKQHSILKNFKSYNFLKNALVLTHRYVCSSHTLIYTRLNSHIQQLGETPIQTEDCETDIPELMFYWHRRNWGCPWILLFGEFKTSYKWIAVARDILPPRNPLICNYIFSMTCCSIYFVDCFLHQLVYQPCRWLVCYPIQRKQPNDVIKIVINRNR